MYKQELDAAAARTTATTTGQYGERYAQPRYEDGHDEGRYGRVELPVSYD